MRCNAKKYVLDFITRLLINNPHGGSSRSECVLSHSAMGRIPKFPIETSKHCGTIRVFCHFVQIGVLSVLDHNTVPMICEILQFYRREKHYIETGVQSLFSTPRSNLIFYFGNLIPRSRWIPSKSLGEVHQVKAVMKTKKNKKKTLFCMPT
jgi:hypothetical protein